MAQSIYVVRAMSLKSLGFATYADYLASALWKKVRANVLKRDGYWCRKCNKVSAHHVHHVAYDLATMKGKNLNCLYSVCDICHDAIEFDGDRKRKSSEVIAVTNWFPARHPESVPVKPKKQKRLKVDRLATEREKQEIAKKCQDAGLLPDQDRIRMLTKKGFGKWCSEVNDLLRIKKRQQQQQMLKEQEAARRKEDRSFN